MKILFIANQWMGIYKNIEAEMLRQGHTVTVIPNVRFPGDPYGNYKNNFISRLKLRGWNKRVRQYWTDNYETIKGNFDILFVISGTSLNEWSIDYIKSLNPGLKTVYYTWDNCKYYAFDRHIKYFDKAYTFDIEDAKTDRRWILLPIPYSPTTNTNLKIKYDIFGMGSDHSDRMLFYKRIYDQLNCSTLRYYLKLVTRPKGFLGTLKAYLLQKDKMAFKKMSLIKSKAMEEVMLNKPITTEEYNDLIAESKCILDDARPNQSGLTARFMWALAEGKKILTTNTWALDYDFVTSDLVRIIDSSDPKIPYDFVESPLKFQKMASLDKYSYSNWVKTILS